MSDLLGYSDCDTTQGSQFSGSLDIDTNALGAETRKFKYPEQCQLASSVEFWRGQGMGHGPALSPAFRPAVLDWLYAHPKQRLRFDDKDTLTWPAQVEADSYNMYSGTTGGLDGSDYGTCLGDLDGDDTNTTYLDTSVPSSGQVQFYLMSYDSGGVEGGIGRDGSGVSRANVAPCP